MAAQLEQLAMQIVELGSWCIDGSSILRVKFLSPSLTAPKLNWSRYSQTAAKLTQKDPACGPVPAGHEPMFFPKRSKEPVKTRISIWKSTIQGLKGQEAPTGSLIVESLLRICYATSMIHGTKYTSMLISRFKTWRTLMVVSGSLWIWFTHFNVLFNDSDVEITESTYRYLPSNSWWSHYVFFWHFQKGVFPWTILGDGMAMQKIIVKRYTCHDIDFHSIFPI